jgi:hypothetical protein
MTTQRPIFNPLQWELRNYTNQYLTQDQQTQVGNTENRVNQQLNWVAQMLGWSGANYWDNLPETVSQKRQLMGGTFGVYNSFIVADICAAI